MKTYNGFEMYEFEFKGRRAIVVLADEKNRTAKWLNKTEYFDAFPEVEIELLKCGYNLAYVANKTRWCLDEDIKAKAEFSDYLVENYGFEKQCVVVGMSCGGLIGIKFAGQYPDYVSVLYLDAPVINLLSCPAGLGRASKAEWEEFKENTGMKLIDLISYREHPLDYIPTLLETDKKIILTCGDEDESVPYEENGLLLNNYYEEHGGIIKTIIKKGYGHHPHGLEDPMPIVEFIKKWS